jgi:hypothetical protein
LCFAVLAATPPVRFLGGDLFADRVRGDTDHTHQYATAQRLDCEQMEFDLAHPGDRDVHGKDANEAINRSRE